MKAWPRLFISHCKAISTVSPTVFWDPFILSHLLVSFHFCLLSIEQPYSVHVFTCIPHMFSNVYIIMHFFLHNCILLYVHKTNLTEI